MRAWDAGPKTVAKLPSPGPKGLLVLGILRPIRPGDPTLDLSRASAQLQLSAGEGPGPAAKGPSGTLAWEPS